MRRMLDPKEAGGGLPSTVEFDAEGNRTVSKNLTISGDIKKPEFASTFTNGKIPTAIAKNYNLGDVVSTSLGNHSSGSGYNYDCTPLFFKKRDASFAPMNPTLYYAYAKEDSNNFTVAGLMLQGNIGISLITIHADGIAIRITYLNSTPNYSNYLFPQVANINDYSSLYKNIVNNSSRFISITGMTTKGGQSTSYHVWDYECSFTDTNQTWNNYPKLTARVMRLGSLSSVRSFNYNGGNARKDDNSATYMLPRYTDTTLSQKLRLNTISKPNVSLLKENGQFITDDLIYEVKWGAITNKKQLQDLGGYLITASVKEAADQANTAKTHYYYVSDPGREGDTINLDKPQRARKVGNEMQ